MKKKLLIKILIFSLVFIGGFTVALFSGIAIANGKAKSAHRHEWSQIFEETATCEQNGTRIFACSCGELKEYMVKNLLRNK